MHSFFKPKKKIIIGSLHLPPLIGIEGHAEIDKGFTTARKDLVAFDQGGVDAVIYENNYDIPHTEFLTHAQSIEMACYGDRIKMETKLPIGISALWNDYRTALSISSALNLKFIRVPVFVDTVKTDYGIVKPVADEVNKFKKELDLNNVGIFTDIHVKHSKLVSKMSLLESARLAIKKGSDGLILTGGWTGDPPMVETIRDLRSQIGNFPIIIGSGVDHKNIRDYFKYCDAVIVSTSLKSKSKVMHSKNIRPYDSRVSKKKVELLVKSK